MAETRKQTQVFRFDQLAVQVKDKIDPAEADVDRYVGLEHIDPEALKIRRWGETSDVESSKILFKSGDIIFGKRRAYQRKLAVADFDGICSAHAMVLRPKTDVVLEEFLPFFMQSDIFMDRAVKISVGGLSPTINWGDLAKEEFALPLLEEQQRIADVLTGSQEVREAYHRVLEECETVHRSLCARLFNKKSMSRLGDATVELKVGIVVQPAALYSSDPTTGVPVLMAENVVSGRLTNEVFQSITTKANEKNLKSIVRAQDVVITRRGNVGRAAVVTEDHAGRNAIDLVIAKCAPELLPQYLSVFLNSPNGASYISAYTSGRTIPFLSTRTISRMPIPRSSISEQETAVSKITHLRDAEHRANARVVEFDRVQRHLINNATVN